MGTVTPGAAATTAASTSLSNNDTQDVEFDIANADLWEIGCRAVWSLSSAKPGNGVTQLRDNDNATFWQSDGPQPHKITIQFPRKVSVSHVAMYLDYVQDESYTPQKITLKAGSHANDLQQMMVFSLSEPQGWVMLSLNEDRKPFRTRLLQIIVTQNHQSGRDVHIRQLKVFGPRESPLQQDPLSAFSTIEFLSKSTIR
eukprot:c6353_g1_i1.p1 GENE.c6353_g1_i1~~c6353_g1_i1.p1  ORF type:complete len:199 (+),score=38.27 c6353_g1_i1:95-691(+)